MFYSDHRFSDYTWTIFFPDGIFAGSSLVMSLQVADLFRFYDSILADKMQCFLIHVTSCIQFDFSRVQIQYPFWLPSRTNRC
jgi:hypothetical protein